MSRSITLVSCSISKPSFYRHRLHNQALFTSTVVETGNRSSRVKVKCWSSRFPILWGHTCLLYASLLWIQILPKTGIALLSQFQFFNACCNITFYDTKNIFVRLSSWGWSCAIISDLGIPSLSRDISRLHNSLHSCLTLVGSEFKQYYSLILIHTPCISIEYDYNESDQVAVV